MYSLDEGTGNGRQRSQTETQLDQQCHGFHTRTLVEKSHFSGFGIQFNGFCTTDSNLGTGTTHILISL